MWPFRRKIDITELCQEFYNSQIFRPDVRSGVLIWDGVLKSLTDLDGSFASIGQAEFILELNSLRAEVFGLAWVHRLREEEYILPEVLFTRRYLESMNRGKIWEVMADYNRTVLASAEQVDPREQARKDVLAEWVAAGVDRECAERAANRLGSQESWDQGITARMLAETFQRRVGRPLNDDAAARLEQTIQGLYDTSRDAIKKAKVRPGSWP